MAKILIVDDNRDLAEVLVLLLGEHGHDVKATCDGATALAEAEEFVPDAILLDISLPTMNGIEIARRVRREIGGSMRLIAHTALPRDDLRDQQMRRAGFDCVLTKPAALQHIIEALNSPHSRH
jgi:CheY-like chemotaxis protein